MAVVTDNPLAGRCATCAYFQSVRLDPVKNVNVGECAAGQWPRVRPETSSCPEWVQEGTLKQQGRAKPAATTTRRARAVASKVEDEPPRRAPIEIEVDDMDEATFRSVLREILREELALSETPIAERYRGGEIILKSGKAGLQDKKVPIEAFFHKIVMVRDKLRVLEQRINANNKLTDDEKVNLQQYITGCYGTLTTFNVLFREDEDKFVGAAADAKE